MDLDPIIATMLLKFVGVILLFCMCIVSYVYWCWN